MSTFALIEHLLESGRRTGALDTAFWRWQHVEPDLAAHDSLTEILALCRRQQADPSSKQLIVAALCRRAGRAHDQDAALVLVWLFLPALIEDRRVAGWLRVLDRAEIEAELLAGFWEAVASPDCDRLAGRLVNAARWRLARALRTAITWSARTAPLPEHTDSLQVHDPAPVTGDLLATAVASGAVSRLDAELLVARRGQIRALCARHGLTLPAGQSRRRRARQRLRAWAADHVGV